MKRESTFGRGRHPFFEKSRSERKRGYMWVKGELARTALEHGGKFITDDLVDGTANIVWAAFLAKKAPNYYRVALHKTTEPYAEAIDDLIKACKFDEFSSIVHVPHVVYCPDYEHITFELLKNLDLGDLQPSINDINSFFSSRPLIPDRQLARKILANSGIIAIREKWTLRHQYRWGTGLSATVCLPGFTIESINAFIERFMQHGEKNFQSSELIHHSFEDLCAYFRNET